MIRIFIDGKTGFLPIEGDFESEDGTYIYLISRGLRKRIPRVSVAYIEEDLSLDVAEPPHKTRDTPESTIKSDPLSVNELLNKRVIEDRVSASVASQTEPEEVILPADLPISVVFQGDKSGAIEVFVPSKYFTQNYNPELAAAIFSNQSIQEFMLPGLTIDGLPQVNFRLKQVVVKVASAVAKVPESGLGALLSKGLGGFSSSARPPLKTPLPQSFTMTDSPFSKVPDISGEDKWEDGDEE